MIFHNKHIFYRFTGVLTILVLMLGMTVPAQACTGTMIRSVSETHTTPSAADNDYTRINNAIHAASSGTSFVLQGTFNFAETNAKASWKLGSDGVAGTDDDWTISVPPNLNNITLTAEYLGAATIDGGGDWAEVDMETFLMFYNNGTNQNWTISNLNITGFDISIAEFCCGGSPSNAYDGTKIINNSFIIPTDLSGPASGNVDISQNIGIHLAYGKNQTVAYNTFDFAGDGVSDSSAPANWYDYGISGGNNFSSNIALQSNTHGGAAYDGLKIEHNILRVLNTQSSSPARYFGIWENGHSHTSNISVSYNTFINLAAGNDADLNRQVAFRITSHSSASTTVAYNNNVVQGANIGFITLDVASGTQPLVMKFNMVTSVQNGLMLRGYASAALSGNSFSGTGAGVGILAPANTSAAMEYCQVNGFSTGVENSGTFTGSHNELTGNATGLLNQVGGSAAITGSNISGNTTWGLNNADTSSVDATINWWGSPNGPGGSNNGVNGVVTTTPYAGALISGTTNSVHEVGETGTLDTNITANDVYGLQLVTNHDPAVLTFSSGQTHNTASWFWDITQIPFTPSSGKTTLVGSMQGRTNAATLSGESVATWTYSCTAPGTSLLTYNTTAGLGSKISNKNGFEIPAAFTGGVITCTENTASVEGIIKLQGRLNTSPSPAGWNGAMVYFTCSNAAQCGTHLYQATTDSTGHYAITKSGAGTGVVVGTYVVSVQRRAYLGTVNATPVPIALGTNTVSTANQMLGGDIVPNSIVDINDLSSVGFSFFTVPTGGADTGADINGDNVINVFDLVLVGGNFNLTSSNW